LIPHVHFLITYCYLELIFFIYTHFNFTISYICIEAIIFFNLPPDQDSLPCGRDILNPRSQHISDHWIKIGRSGFQTQYFEFKKKLKICTFCKLSNLNSMVANALSVWMQGYSNQREFFFEKRSGKRFKETWKTLGQSAPLALKTN
jgi:hypothetical protein